MKGILGLCCLALMTGPLLGAAPAGSNGEPASYQLRVPVVITTGSPVQRLAIPAAVLAASRSAALSDVRIFDAANLPMPIARVAPATGPSRCYDLPALPILGAADSLDVTGVSLRLDGSGRARVAQVVGTLAGGPATATVLGALFDVRAVTGDASSLTLDAEVPQAQPVTFTVEASADLKEWRPLGEKIVYRAAGDGAAVLQLGGAALASDYLRVTWRAASRLLAPVMVRSAVLLTRPGAAVGEVIAAALPPLADAHVAEFALPFASSLESLQVIPTGSDVIIPLRVFARDNREQPWTLLGDGTAARRNAGETPQDIMLSGRSFRFLRIEADERSAGFTSPPALLLGFTPRAIMFLTAGRAPFTLAVGRPGAVDPYLPLESVMTQALGKAVPVASATPTNTVLQLEPVRDEQASQRQALLWIVLLAATALLAAMAWLLWRSSAAKA